MHDGGSATLAARRGGITSFVAPQRNAKDLGELPQSLNEQLEIRLVTRIDEALAIALTQPIRIRGELTAAT